MFSRKYPIQNFLLIFWPTCNPKFSVLSEFTKSEDVKENQEKKSRSVRHNHHHEGTPSQHSSKTDLNSPGGLFTALRYGKNI